MPLNQEVPLITQLVFDPVRSSQRQPRGSFSARYSPTLEEIEEAKRKIQESWPPEIERIRRGEDERSAVIPEFSATDTNGRVTFEPLPS